MSDTIPNVRETLAFIAGAHAGQMYGDQPFYFHPVAVAEAVTPPTGEPGLHAAALLHDVLEDTPVTAGYLRAMGYDDYVIRTVEILTRPDGMAYMDYIRGIIESRNIWAMRIKLVDNRLNLASRPEMSGRYNESISLLEFILGEPTCANPQLIAQPLTGYPAQK